MIEQVSTAITFVAFFYDSTNNQGATGLTVTVDVRRVSDTTELVTGASATEIGDGFYKYTLTAGSTGTESGYVGVFKTSDTDVSQRHIPAMWSVGVAGVENLDAAISTRSTVTTAQVNAECDTALANYDPPTKAELDTAINSLPASNWTYGRRTLTGYVVTGVDEEALGVSEDLADFYPGETVSFSITCTIDGVAQDITSDTVTLYMKKKRTDTDANAVLTKSADVATEGASGIANFKIDPADTEDLAPRTYEMDIVWVLSGGDEYVIHDQSITLLQRVSDA